jgi:hypothetical protein
MGWSEKIKSEALDMMFSYHHTGKVMTEDRVVYSKREVESLKESGGVTKDVHLIKKIFNGEVV